MSGAAGQAGVQLFNVHTIGSCTPKERPVLFGASLRASDYRLYECGGELTCFMNHCLDLCISRHHPPTHFLHCSVSFIGSVRSSRTVAICVLPVLHWKWAPAPAHRLGITSPRAPCLPHLQNIAGTFARAAVSSLVPRSPKSSPVALSLHPKLQHTVTCLCFNSSSNRLVLNLISTNYQLILVVPSIIGPSQTPPAIGASAEPSCFRLHRVRVAFFLPPSVGPANDHGPKRQPQEHAPLQRHPTVSWAPRFEECSMKYIRSRPSSGILIRSFCTSTVCWSLLETISRKARTGLIPGRLFQSISIGLFLVILSHMCQPGISFPGILP